MTQYDPIRKPSVTALVKTLRESDSDFEWYPTTTEIIDTVRDDLRSFACVREGEEIRESVLDCGAGDGRVLESLTKGDRYAIEMAEPLLNEMHRSIFIVGTDFHKQTLIDKKVNCIFSNPPYRDYVAWTLKILKEANAPVAYLVIPERWASNPDIQDAIESRKARVDVIGEFDFLEADRKARARVNVVRFNLSGAERQYWYRDASPRVDPFELWFEESFKLQATQSPKSEFEQREAVRSSVKGRVSGSGELIKDQGLVHTLEEFYYRDLGHLMKNYQSVCELDPELLSEMGVSLTGLKGALKLKISSLKDVYWQELFDNLGAVTDRLTSDSRKKMLDKLTANTSIDFNAQNSHAVVIWMIKNANIYFDDQLVTIFERMTQKANVAMYKSNQKTFGDEQWRYCRQPDDLERYKLEYRVVLDRVGGLCNSEWSFEHTACGLTDRAGKFIDDLRTVASNIGFDTYGLPRARQHEWASSRKINFEYRDRETGELKILFEAKAFKNGNLHIKFCPTFIIKLNVEFGRLKGWVKSASEAAEEMNIDIADAASSFGSNLQLAPKDLPLLLCAA
jgi:hypothetical protein